MVPIDGTDTIATFDGKPTPVGLQDLVWSQCLEDEFTPLVIVGLHEYPVSNLEGFAASLHALVEGPFLSGLCLFHGIPYYGDQEVEALEEIILGSPGGHYLPGVGPRCKSFDCHGSKPSETYERERDLPGATMHLRIVSRYYQA